jgi:acetolactate synthase-1/2/3 large subunit
MSDSQPMSTDEPQTPAPQDDPVVAPVEAEPEDAGATPAAEEVVGEDVTGAASGAYVGNDEAGEALPEADATDPSDEVVAPAEPTPAADHGADGTETSPVDAETPDGGTATVGQAVASALRAAGVRWAFTVAGESFLGLLEGLVESGVRVVATRHEGGAAFMAEAVAQLTGRPAVVLGTRAVGAANLSIGVHTARADSAPLIALVGQVDRRVRGRESFQEADVAGSIGALAKYAAEATTAEEARRVTSEGIQAAVGGRPGPVVLSYSEDLLDEIVEGWDEAPDAGTSSAPRPDPETVRSILHLLAAAERPVILAGAGVLRARCSTDLMRLAETLRVPVISSWRRGDVIPNEHPLYLGMTGYGAPATVRQRLEAADAVLVLGSRLNEITTFGYHVPRPGVRWAHVDLEPHGGSDQPAPDIALAADARAFLRAALRRLDGAVLEVAVADRRAAGNATDRAAYEAASVVDGVPWDGPGVHPGRIVASLGRVLPEDAILTTDAGSFAGWLARGFRFRRPGTFLGPTSGAMGYGLPAAIAAALVHRDRPVVAWTGDGGFAMTMAELETAVRERVRVIALVLDNERYGMIHSHQGLRPGGRTVATDLGPIDFAAVARGLGAHGVRVERDDAFEAALRTALAAIGPTVIHLPLDRGWTSVDATPG